MRPRGPCSVHGRTASPSTASHCHHRPFSHARSQPSGAGSSLHHATRPPVLATHISPYLPISPPYLPHISPGMQATIVLPERTPRQRRSQIERAGANVVPLSSAGRSRSRDAAETEPAPHCAGDTRLRSRGCEARGAAARARGRGRRLLPLARRRAGHLRQRDLRPRDRPAALCGPRPAHAAEARPKPHRPLLKRNRAARDARRGGGGRPGKRPPAARHWPVARRTLRLRGGGGPLEEPSRSRLGASLQAIFVCTGGGSLIAGVAAIVKQLMPGPSDAVREAAARREGARLTPRHCLEQAPRSSESSRRRTT